MLIGTLYASRVTGHVICCHINKQYIILYILMIFIGYIIMGGAIKLQPLLYSIGFELSVI